MLFDPEPKTRREDLYDRENELKSLLTYLKKERLIIIYGVRRVGKTSLLRVALNEGAIPYAYIDIRGMYDKSGNVSPSLFLKDLVDSFKRNLVFYERVKFDIRGALNNLRGLRFKDFEIEFSPIVKVDLHDLFKRIDDWCIDHGIRFILALDEAQYLRYSRFYSLLLSWIFDNLKEITIVLAGSEVGLLQDFLESSKVGRPLGGRVKFEIKLDRFNLEQSIDFLEKGFLQTNVRPGVDEIEKTVRELDGIVGWLTMYGRYRVSGLSHEESLSKTIKEAESIVKDELYNLIKDSKERYFTILKSICQGYNSWAAIKDYLEMKVSPMADSHFNYLLNRLVKFGFIEKNRDGYSITDPILIRVLKS